jgi:hypothetical protein
MSSVLVHMFMFLYVDYTMTPKSQEIYYVIKHFKENVFPVAHKIKLTY